MLRFKPKRWYNNDKRRLYNYTYTLRVIYTPIVALK